MKMTPTHRHYHLSEFLRILDRKLRPCFAIWAERSPKIACAYESALQSLIGFISERFGKKPPILAPIVFDAADVETVRRTLPDWNKTSVPSHCLRDILRELQRQRLLEAPRPRIVFRTPRRLIVHPSPKHMALWCDLNAMIGSFLKSTLACTWTPEVNPAIEGDLRALASEQHENVCAAMFALTIDGMIMPDTLGRHLYSIRRADVDWETGSISLPVNMLPLRSTIAPQHEARGQETGSPKIRIQIGLLSRLFLNRLLIFQNKWGDLLGHSSSDPYLFPAKYRENRALFASWLDQLLLRARQSP